MVGCTYLSMPWPLTLHWCHNYHDGVSNHQPHGCLLNRLFSRRSKKTSKLRVTGLCAENSPGPVNSPHKGPVTQKMFHLMTSSWKNLWIKKSIFVDCTLQHLLHYHGMTLQLFYPLVWLVWVSDFVSIIYYSFQHQAWIIASVWLATGCLPSIYQYWCSVHIYYC